ncbi:MAG: dodecin family protein [Deltaproteobacteria bacterium]
MTTYRMIEVVGVSDKSYEDAIKTAIDDAKSYLENSHQTLEGVEWFQVLDQRGRLSDGKISEFQIRLNVAFNIKK